MTCPGEPTADETTLVAILHNILQDTSRPLYRTLSSVPSIEPARLQTNTWRDQVPVFEVEEDEEPPYERRTTPSPVFEAPPERPVEKESAQEARIKRKMAEPVEVVETESAQEAPVFEVEEDEEPPYKKRRTVST